MDRRAVLGTFALFAVPRAAGAQPAGKVHHVQVNPNAEIRHELEAAGRAPAVAVSE